MQGGFTLPRAASTLTGTRDDWERRYEPRWMLLNDVCKYASGATVGAEGQTGFVYENALDCVHLVPDSTR